MAKTKASKSNKRAKKLVPVKLAVGKGAIVPGGTSSMLDAATHVASGIKEQAQRMVKNLTKGDGASSDDNPYPLKGKKINLSDAAAKRVSEVIKNLTRNDADRSTVVVGVLRRVSFDLAAQQVKANKITDYIDDAGLATIKFRELRLGHAFFQAKVDAERIWVKCGKTSAISFRNHSVLTRMTHVSADPVKSRFDLKSRVTPLDLGIFASAMLPTPLITGDGPSIKKASDAKKDAKSFPVPKVNRLGGTRKK